MTKPNVYFIGIGGIGMSALARYFLFEGCAVAGYDRVRTPLTDSLSAEGARVHYDDDPDAIPPEFRDPENSVVVYTPAVPSDHRELEWFRSHGFTVEKRSQMLGHISEGKYVMAVAGTHGKTTITTMIAWLNYVAASGRDCRPEDITADSLSSGKTDAERAQGLTANLGTFGRCKGRDSDGSAQNPDRSADGDGNDTAQRSGRTEDCFGTGRAERYGTSADEFGTGRAERYGTSADEFGTGRAERYGTSADEFGTGRAERYGTSADEFGTGGEEYSARSEDGNGTVRPEQCSRQDGSYGCAQRSGRYPGGDLTDTAQHSGRTEDCHGTASAEYYVASVNEFGTGGEEYSARSEDGNGTGTPEQCSRREGSYGCAQRSGRCPGGDGTGSAFLGGISVNFGSNLVLGTGRRLAVEADEFDRSFLRLSPDVAVITSTDADHLDIYGTHQEMKKTFGEFVSRIKPGGTLIRHHAVEAFAAPEITQYTYSLDEGDFHTQGLEPAGDGTYRFNIICPDTTIEKCRLGVPGLTNVENVIAAVAAMWTAGFDENKLREALETFRGVKRRFEFYINSPQLVYMDDYAHHPRELSSAIGSVRAMFPGRRITAIFQPHLYSRTRDFYREFAQSLSMADRVILTPIYPARELPMEGVSSEMIGQLLTVPYKVVEKEDVARELTVEAGDVVVTFGAGDIDRHCQEIAETLQDRLRAMR